MAARNLPLPSLPRAEGARPRRPVIAPPAPTASVAPLPRIPQLDPMPTDRPVAAPPRSHRSWHAPVPWFLMLGVGLGAAVFHQLDYRPLQAAKRAVDQQQAQTQADLATARSRLGAVSGRLSAVEVERLALGKELVSIRQAGDDNRSDLRTLRGELDKSLEREIADGSVTILERGDHLGIRIRENLLFAPGTLQLTGRGQERLLKIAGALLQLPNQAFRIAGHVDRRPFVAPMVRRMYFTNWELSSARAIQVVLHLSRVGQVPAAQLAVAAFGNQRPISEQKTGNGRIEITLMGRRPLGSTGEDAQ